MCLVNDNEEFNAVKNFVTVHIGVEARMGVIVHSRLVAEKVLTVVEGEFVDIKCYAEEGYPPASFLWLAPIRKNLSAGLQIFQVDPI